MFLSYGRPPRRVPALDGRSDPGSQVTRGDLGPVREARAGRGASRRNLAEIFLLAPVSYFVLDGSGMIEDANLAGAELFGVARSQLSGRALTSFLAPISASSLTSGLGTVASGDGA